MSTTFMLLMFIIIHGQVIPPLQVNNLNQQACLSLEQNITQEITSEGGVVLSQSNCYDLTDGTSH